MSKEIVLGYYEDIEVRYNVTIKKYRNYIEISLDAVDSNSEWSFEISALDENKNFVITTNQNLYDYTNLDNEFYFSISEENRKKWKELSDEISNMDYSLLEESISIKDKIEKFEEKKVICNKLNVKNKDSKLPFFFEKDYFSGRCKYIGTIYHPFHEEEISFTTVGVSSPQYSNKGNYKYNNFISDDEQFNSA